MKIKILFLRLSLSITACAAIFLLPIFSALAQNLFVGNVEENGTGDIFQYTPAGTISTFILGLTNGASGPFGLAFDKSGNLYIGAVGAIIKCTPSGVQTEFSIGEFENFALAYDKTGNLFVANFELPTGTIFEVTPSGVQSTFASIGAPDGLAFDSRGDLFASDWIDGNIYEFVNTNGTLSTTPTLFVGGLNNSEWTSTPSGLTIGSNGDLFVAVGTANVGTGHPSILEIAPSGEFVPSPYSVGLDTPEYLAFDNGGDLFVSEARGVFEIMANGSVNQLAISLYGPQGLAFKTVPNLAAVTSGRAFDLTVSMPSPFYSTIVQASTNMVNWANIYTNTPPFTFTDSISPTIASRFYRALLGP